MQVPVHVGSMDNVQEVVTPTSLPVSMTGLADVSLKVMTFNLRRHKESDGVNSWSRRRDAAVAVLGRQAPDLLGIQEGLQHQLSYILERFPEYGAIGEARFGGRRDEYNAILYRKDRFKVAASGNFWLSDTPDVPGSRTWGNLVPRMATWGRFVDKDTGAAFHHLNTHLDHLVPRARARGARLIESRLPRDVPVLVTGDFNALPRGGTYRYLTGEAGFTDSLRACREQLLSRWNATFHHFTGRGLYRIDYILGRGIREFQEHTVVRDRIDGQVPSDHFPVVSHVKFPATITAAVDAARAAA